MNSSCSLYRLLRSVQITCIMTCSQLQPNVAFHRLQRTLLTVIITTKDTHTHTHSVHSVRDDLKTVCKHSRLLSRWPMLASNYNFSVRSVLAVSALSHARDPKNARARLQPTIALHKWPFSTRIQRQHNGAATTTTHTQPSARRVRRYAHMLVSVCVCVSCMWGILKTHTLHGLIGVPRCTLVGWLIALLAGKGDRGRWNERTRRPARIVAQIACA